MLNLAVCFVLRVYFGMSEQGGENVEDFLVFDKVTYSIYKESL